MKHRLTSLYLGALALAVTVATFVAANPAIAACTKQHTT